MAYRFFIIILITVVVLSCAPGEDTKAVAYLKADGSYVINSEKVNAKILNDLKALVKNFHPDTTEVISVVPIGEKHEKVFFIQITDLQKNQRLTRYLFLRNNNFYFFEDLTGEKIIDENLFFISYYSVIGTLENNCIPNIAYSEGELFWITGDKLFCAIDSPCKSQQHILMQ